MPRIRTAGYAVIVFFLLPLISLAQAQAIKEYKVIKGDTLWDITKTELNDPFLWPDVWKENSGIANPDRIYPDQVIRIPLYLIQKEKREEAAALKSASPSQESAPAEKQPEKEIEKKVTPQPAMASPEDTPVADQRYQGIKGIVLYNGDIIEGQIISMNVYTIEIRTKDDNVMSYSFEEDVESFIKK